MFGPYSLEKSIYDNYTADDPRTRRRLSLYETSIWGPQAAADRNVPLDLNVMSEAAGPFRSGDSQMTPPGLATHNHLDMVNNFATDNFQAPRFAQVQMQSQNQAMGMPHQAQNMAQPANNQNMFLGTPQWNYALRMHPSVHAAERSRLFSGDAYPRVDQNMNYMAMPHSLGGNYALQNAAPLWSDSTWRSSFPMEAKDKFPTNLNVHRLSEGSATQTLPPVSAQENAMSNADADRTLSQSFMHGVNLNSSATPTGQIRRHSYGEGFGYGNQNNSATDRAPRLGSQHSQHESSDRPNLGAVHEYFSSDPHERVKVTTEYLEQRFFDEEKYLGDHYQLPKFPVEHLLRNYLLVLVGFKAGRIDVFYMPDNVDELKEVKIGDLVIVEADRGRDLGKIVKMNISIDEARLLKLLQFLEQQAAISEHTSVNDLSVKSLQNTGGGHHGHHGANAPPTLHFPKSILSLAQPSEALQILNKKQDEEKACRLCLAKIASTTSMLSASSESQSSLTSSDLMQMKLIDAEYQFDRRKLIFYYSTSKRIDFRDLVRELFRIYKTRIWMCAVNGIPYVPLHQRNKGAKNSNQGRNGNHSAGGMTDGGGGRNGQNGGSRSNPPATVGAANKVSPTTIKHSNDQLAAQPVTPPTNYRRFSYHSGMPAYPRRVHNEIVLDFGVPRNYHEPVVEEESGSHRDSGESLVLKSLVDTLNH